MDAVKRARKPKQQPEKAVTHDEADAKSFKRRTGLSTGESDGVVERCRKHIEASYNFDRQNRLEAEIDLQFVAGDQWPQAIKARRKNHQMLIVNKLPQVVNQIVNPVRQADISIKVKGIDDTGDPQMASIYDQIISDIQYKSDAKQVYTNGNEHQVKCGIGWWGITTEYVKQAGFEQEIRLKKVENPLSCYPDPGAKHPTHRDGMQFAIVEMWPRETFKRKWPKARAMDSVDVPNNAPSSAFQWNTQEAVGVAEYWERVEATCTIVQTEDGEIIDITELSEEEVDQIDAETPIVNQRSYPDYKVFKYVVTGVEVLEKKVAWKGSYIPYIRANGSETPLKSGTYRFGVVRFARDPQQMLNFYRTAAAEALAIAPKTPWVVTDKMVGKYLPEWQTVNQDNKPFLRYEVDPLAPTQRPERPQAPDVPTALFTESNIASDDIKSTTGVYDASLGARSNETSGRAINAREAQGDTANLHYEDNLMSALIHTGVVLVDLIPKVYDTERIIRLTGDNGKEQSVRINRVLYSMDGEDVLENDISQANFDVRVTVGKNYLTQRVEVLNAMAEMAKSNPNPQAQILLNYLMVKNSDWPEAEKIAGYFRNMVPPNILADPNDPNAPKPPSPMDDPVTVAGIEKTSAQIDEIKQRSRKTAAETVKILAETDVLDGQIDGQFGGQPLNEESGEPQEAPQAPPKGFVGGSLTLQ